MHAPMRSAGRPPAHDRSRTARRAPATPWLPLALLPICLLTACAAPPQPADPACPDPGVDRADAHVRLLHPALARQVSVQGLQAQRLASGPVQLSLRLLNCSDAPLALRARAHFMTAEDTPAEPPSAWQPLLLAPRALEAYQVSSLAGDAVARYQVELAPMGAPR